MRGDPPGRTVCETCESRSTPHARGSTAIRVFPDYSALVYPACAGIHPEHLGPLVTIPRLPRMPGDPPQVSFGTFLRPVSTPHARGSTTGVLWHLPSASVYPACAGIHPTMWPGSSAGSCLPRMRGDPPIKIVA